VTFSRPETATGAGLNFEFFASMRDSLALGCALTAHTMTPEQIEAYDRLVKSYKIDLDLPSGALNPRRRTPWDHTQQIVRNLSRNTTLVRPQSAGMLIPVLCTWVPSTPVGGTVHYMWRLVAGDKRRALEVGIDKCLQEHASAAADDVAASLPLDVMLDVDHEAIVPHSFLSPPFKPLTREQYKAIVLELEGLESGEGGEGGKDGEGSSPLAPPSPLWPAKFAELKTQLERLSPATDRSALLREALLRTLQGHDPASDSFFLAPVPDKTYDPATCFRNFHPSFVPSTRWKFACMPVSMFLDTRITFLDILRMLADV
jgi:hypothetical protein